MNRDRQTTENFLKALEHIEYGAMTITTPDGVRHVYQGTKPGAHADVTLHDWRMVGRMLRDGDIGIAETYRDGWWSAVKVEDFLEAGLQNEAVLKRYIFGGSLGRLKARLLYLLRHNTLRGSRRNIFAHYDLGNAFYQLWLDPSMTYSSALFASPSATLHEAQQHKYDRILDRLGARSGRLLEIGCGWGGFAARALERADLAIKGITISKAQHDYAAARLGGRADIALEDYRQIEGKYDHLVSIEMFEAVGERFWPVYFQKVAALLEKKGKAVIQTITIADQHFEEYRKGGDAIRSFVFPGGMLPSPSRFQAEAAKAGLKTTDRHAFGQDYAKTLEHWLMRFEEKRSEIMALGFDEPFCRIWRYYLAACIASFKVGRTDVMQWELQHG
ncbi:MAG: class I SAM-dependent methyltransferase [Alphaproteobacteria bacterium]|jgi:cyclopropane-fatty-acyl-phospholipid synthase|nr:cyclopropane-fatty-acyl-phospholipid synthase family protein [Rickettsiales bacterium]